MARAGTKRQRAIEVMSANAHLPMSEVLPLLTKELDEPNPKGFYVWIVRNGMAPGVIEDLPRKARGTKTAEPKKDETLDLPVYLDLGPANEPETENFIAATQELAEISEEEKAAKKAANLEKIKAAVAAKKSAKAENAAA